LYHNIVNQYCSPHHDPTRMMYCQLVLHPDKFTNINTDSTGIDHHSALQGDAQLNFLICNNSSITNSVIFDIETNSHGQKEVLAMVGKYLEPLIICYDMGWQRCSSGTTYNRMSGHAFLVSANSNKILRRLVYSKSCCTCAQRLKKKGAASSDDVGPPNMANASSKILGELPTDHQDHCCSKNFRGSSKSMEPHRAVACDGIVQNWDSIHF